jgi:hypothetical protein
MYTLYYVIIHEHENSLALHINHIQFGRSRCIFIMTTLLRSIKTEVRETEHLKAIPMLRYTYFANVVYFQGNELDTMF